MGNQILQDGRWLKNPYSRRERCLRIFWEIVFWLFFFPVPRIFPKWHRFLLVCFGAKLGRGVRIFPSVRVAHPWMIEVGANSTIGEGVRLYSLGKIKIGKHTLISQRAHVCAGTHDYADKAMPLIRAPIIIGDGCWICAEAFIGPNVTIGDGSVIGARSVVTSDLPPNMICAGNPCNVIKPRCMKES